MLGEAFGGEEIGLKKLTEEDMLEIYFCNQKVLKLCYKWADQ